jgi:hypothetical protein
MAIAKRGHYAMGPQNEQRWLLTNNYYMNMSTLPDQVLTTFKEFSISVASALIFNEFKGNYKYRNKRNSGGMSSSSPTKGCQQQQPEIRSGLVNYNETDKLCSVKTQKTPSVRCQCCGKLTTFCCEFCLMNGITRGICSPQ